MKLARIKRANALPICIFPKGIKAGIRCVSLQTIKNGEREVKFCGDRMCTYHEPLH